jgi:hypothetical protein
MTFLKGCSLHACTSLAFKKCEKVEKVKKTMDDLSFAFCMKVVRKGRFTKMVEVWPAPAQPSRRN